MVSHNSGTVLNKVSSSSEALHEQSAVGIERQGGRKGGKKSPGFLPGICFKVKLCYKMHTTCVWTPKLFLGAGVGVPNQVINTLQWA